MPDTNDNLVLPHPEPDSTVGVGWFGSTVSFLGSTIFSFREIHWMVFAVFCFLISNAILAFVAYQEVPQCSACNRMRFRGW